MSSHPGDSENTRIAPPESPIANGPSPRRDAPPRPNLSGCRLSDRGGSQLFVLDREGYGRRIPNYTSYSRLFRDWSGIVETDDLAGLARRPDLAAGTILVRGDSTATVYLLDQGRRRAITSAYVMDKYWFNWDRIFVIRQVLIDHMPLGDDWE